MAVIVTRPAREAARWTERLYASGIEAVALPLLAIGAPADDAEVRRIAAEADRFAAVMFVSANAVHAFLAVDPVFERARAWAPGPATREALLEAGVSADRIDAPADDDEQFDSESLWRQVHDQLRTGDRLLVVRGADAEGRSRGRDWLAQQLSARGVRVETVAAYTRALPRWSAQEQERARRAASDGSVWLFSSSEAAGNLPHLLEGQDWSQAHAIATHPRIGGAVRALGFGHVRECRPTFDDVIASIESDR
jgi:uroporphyrinogen-III synthase